MKCANETFGRLFVRQQGRALHGQHLAKGVNTAPPSARVPKRNGSIGADRPREEAEEVSPRPLDRHSAAEGAA